MEDKFHSVVRDGEGSDQHACSGVSIASLLAEIAGAPAQAGAEETSGFVVGVGAAGVGGSGGASASGDSGH